MRRDVYKLAFNLESRLAKLSITIESLEEVKFQLTYIRQGKELYQEENLFKSKQINSLIHLIDELLYYIIIDFKQEYEETMKVVEELIQKIKHKSQ